MPLKKIIVLINFLFIFTISTNVFAQTTEPKSTTLADLKKKKGTPIKTPTSAEIMRNRISKAKAYLVIKNYGAAVYELENIRKETSDKTVHRVLNVLLMHSYLEQGDYKKAQRLLKELHKAKGSTASIDYLAVAGQVVNGANTLNERYKSLGLSFADRNLPVEAIADIENMRKTLELVVTQAKVLSRNKKASSSAYALLEETSNMRGNLAKDVFDKKRWKDQVAEARENIVNPNSRVIYGVDNPPINSPNPNIIAAKDVKLKPVESETPNESSIDADLQDKEEKPTKEKVKKTNNTDKTGVIRPKDRVLKIINSAEKTESVKEADKDKATEKDSDNTANLNNKTNRTTLEKAVADVALDESLPMSVGSMLNFATKRVNPIYPRQARSMRQTGTVTVQIVVDEKGKVKKVEKTNGPSLLKRAARNAVKKWRFKPFERNGQAVEAKGFVSFNFNL